MRYVDLAKEYIRLHRAIQEVQQAMYGVQKFTSAQGIVYHFICFFNVSTNCLDTTIADGQLAEIKLLNDLPLDVKVAFGAFNNSLMDWADDKGPFPATLPTETQLANLIHRRDAGTPPASSTKSIEDDYRLS